jgi:hypothetical protein
MALAVQEFDVRNATGRRRHITNGFAASVLTPGILSIPAAICLYQWMETACLQCHQWSLHSDWYVQD